VIFEIVSATRQTEVEFAKRPLGQSLARLHNAEIVASIAYANTRGLPEVYNARIMDSTADVLVFVHDDVWITDNFLQLRIIEGLEKYDVVGVAGSKSLAPRQLLWWKADRSSWSGCVAHGAQPLGRVDWFGTFGPCELMDGVLLAVRREHATMFDPQFDFHFYDLDFCRSARSMGLKLGTWPISITHAKPVGTVEGDMGVFDESWKRNAARYLAKWRE
jgi:hypothetical protein